MERKRVAVVGAGPVGLVSLKQCIEDDLDVVCFEATSDVGGLWNYSKNVSENKSSVMVSTVTNLSKECMAFSDFVPSIDTPNFMHHSVVFDYYRSYAKHFNLRERIKFNTTVKRIDKAQDYEATGKWEIEYAEGNVAITELFDAVMICTGHHNDPYLPIIPGLNDQNRRYQGELIHSCMYREPFKYSNKRVVVIGASHSAGEVACELSRFASKVYLSVRSGFHCMSRRVNGLPTDTTIQTRFNTDIRHISVPFYNTFIRSQSMVKIDHELYSIKPSEKNDHHMINDELPDRIACGSIVIKPDIKEFKEHSCVFDNNTTAIDIDAVILCTGYNVSFPFLDDSIVSIDNNWVHLYKNVFPPQLTHSTLAVIGCIQSSISITTISELQARWVTRVFRGICKLPTKKEMENDIEETQTYLKYRFNDDRRHSLKIDAIPYSDTIASFINCKPNLIKYFLFNNPLWQSIYFNGFTAYQYRLNGPGSNYKQAKENILKQNNRIIAPFKTRKTYAPPDASRGIIFNIYGILLILFTIYIVLFSNLF